jgi:hypothetical protein
MNNSPVVAQRKRILMDGEQSLTLVMSQRFVEKEGKDSDWDAMPLVDLDWSNLDMQLEQLVRLWNTQDLSPRTAILATIFQRTPRLRRLWPTEGSSYFRFIIGHSSNKETPEMPTRNALGNAPVSLRGSNDKRCLTLRYLVD